MHTLARGVLTLAVAVVMATVAQAAAIPEPQGPASVPVGAAPAAVAALPVAAEPASVALPAATESTATAAGESTLPPNFLRNCIPGAGPLEKPGADPAGQALRHYMIGRIYISDQDSVMAAREFRQAAALEPTAARAWLNLGLALHDMGNVPAAVLALDEALRLGPTDPMALYLRARIAGGLGQGQLATDLLARLLASSKKGSPYFILGTYHMATMKKDAGDVDAAIEQFKTLMEMLDERQSFFQRYPEIFLLYRNQLQLRQELAKLQVQRGDNDGAIANLKAALAMADRPDTIVDLLGLMCTATIQKKDYERALEWARKIIETNPDGAVGYQRLADVYKAQGKPEAAVTEIEAYRQKNPKNRILGFQVAKLFESLGRNEEAAAIYRDLSAEPAKTPGMSAAAALKLSDIRVQEGKPVEALEALAGAITGDTAEPSLLMRAAKIIDGLKDPEATFRDAQRLVADSVKGYAPFLLVGMLAERAKHPTDAAALYDKALTRQPRAALAYSRKAELLIDIGHHEEALAVYRAAVTAGLDLPVFHRQMGLILEHLDRIDEAIAEYRLAREALPDDETAWYLLAGALGHKGKFDEAEKELRDLIARLPTKAQPLCQLAAVFLAKGDLDAAEKTAAEAQKLDAAAVNPKAILAEVRFRQKKFEEAEKLAREILKDQPEDREVRLLLVYTLSALKQPKRAAEEVRSMLTLEPENVALRYLLSGLDQEMGDRDAAERELQRILQKKPDHAPSNNDLGYMWADRGINLNKAEELIRRALKIEPASAAYMDSLGWVLYKRGLFNDAVKVLEGAAKQAPAMDPVLWEHLGDAYWKLNRRDDAIKAWQEAAKLITAAGAEAKPDEAHRLQEKVEKSKAGGEPPVAPVPPKEEPKKGESASSGTAN